MTTADIVLDSSAVIAFLQREPGADVVRKVLPGSILSTVNAAEIVAKLIQYGLSVDEAIDSMKALPVRKLPFDLNHALTAGTMWKRSKGFGLSLGDRACLALAETMKFPALTADKRWMKFETAIEIRLIR
jgi:PIN domain nuclease of toxin-antitoxin system